MASDNKVKRTDSVSDSSKSATRHNNGTGKQKSTSGTTAETEKVKEHLQHQSKAQSTELVKNMSRTESGKQSSQSESVCGRSENEQDNTDLQAITKGDKSHHSTTQSTYFVVKVRCKYCDKPFNSITNHGKHLKAFCRSCL